MENQEFLQKQSGFDRGTILVHPNAKLSSAMEIQMKFDRYIWDLYCNDEFVQKRIAGIEELTLELWLERFDRTVARINEFLERAETSEEEIELEADPLEYPALDDSGNPIYRSVVEEVAKAALANGPVDCIEEASALYIRLLDQGITLPLYDDDEKTIGTTQLAEGDYWLSEIRNITTGLFLAYPKYFCPYDFRLQFFRFRKMCDEFEIPLAPGVPIRADLRERAMFYLKINESLQEFRRRHQFSPAELCVFLEFAHEKILFEEDEELPDPMKVWFLMGGAGGPVDFETLDNAEEDAFQFWQGNVDTSPGDICLMWCASPRSYLHSIWRAMTEGFSDPFFWGYSSVWIGQPIRVPAISFAEIAADPVLGQKPAVRAHFQGSSGKPFTVQEYDAILAILVSKNFDVSKLPRIPKRVALLPEGLENERDVELKLVEPLLHDLGYTEKNWKRQLLVRMGRGTPYYPDYAFKVKSQRKGDESAKMILETKFRLANGKELEEAYVQAKSYALRLQSQVFVLAAVDGLWIFASGRPGFTLMPSLNTTWFELTDPDTFHKVKLLIGPDAIGK